MVVTYALSLSGLEWSEREDVMKEVEDGSKEWALDMPT